MEPTTGYDDDVEELRAELQLETDPLRHATGDGQITEQLQSASGPLQVSGNGTEDDYSSNAEESPSDVDA